MASARTSRLDCAHAFLVGEAFKRGALRVSSRELLHDEAKLTRAEERPSAPMEFIRAEGRRPYDLIGTTYASLKLVSTGWTTFPVTVLLEDGSELEDYEGLAVTGRCGSIDDSLSEEILLPPPVPGGQAGYGLRGLCFQPESWDGSDVFTAEGYAGIFVVERVKDALEQAHVTNVDLRRLSEIERRWRWTPSGPKVIT
jgi:hypothetical protein